MVHCRKRGGGNMPCALELDQEMTCFYGACNAGSNPINLQAHAASTASSIDNRRVVVLRLALPILEPATKPPLVCTEIAIKSLCELAHTWAPLVLDYNTTPLVKGRRASWEGYHENLLRCRTINACRCRTRWCGNSRPPRSDQVVESLHRYRTRNAGC